ncbi:hypothetical protein PQO03_03895 [Lentisphaera profundi]|uniref:CR-type domain-containing protein n=1 Tax=Lentisphaera profundi TaxID=1658616 RepID=A0ABY7VSB6_9BACT|nr:hypothetical protein [Lentisphaera profundi]WDE97098.1 hypothetical protein PQO03_03895 [Lentisphaera profundi]
MRVLLLLLVSLTVISQEDLSHYKKAMTFKSSWTLYKNAPDNYASYKAFSKSIEDLEASEIKAAAYAYSILGAYFQNKVEYGAITHQKLSDLSQEIGDDKWQGFCRVEQFGDECSVCEGSSEKKRACKKCNGTKTCRNGECRKGQIISLEKIDGKFEEVSTDCSICEASGFCQACGGSGVYKIPCNICRGFGYLLNKMKVREKFKDGLVDMDALVANHILEGFSQDQLAKGKIKRGDRWYTLEEINKMDKSSQLKAERSMLEQRKREQNQRTGELRAKRDKKFNSLENDSILEPEKAKKIIENDFSDEADPVKINLLNIYLKQANLIIKATESENKGLELEAIKLLKEAQKIRDHEVLRSRIRKLKLENLGL